MTEELLACMNLLNDYESIKVSSAREIDHTVSTLTFEILHKDRHFFSLSQSRIRKQLDDDLNNTQRFLVEHPDIIVCEADKGHIAIIPKRNTLLNLQDEHIRSGLDDGTYLFVDNPVIAINRLNF